MIFGAKNDNGNSQLQPEPRRRSFYGMRYWRTCDVEEQRRTTSDQLKNGKKPLQPGALQRARDGKRPRQGIQTD